MSKSETVGAIVIIGLVAGAMMGILLCVMAAIHVFSGKFIVLGICQIAGAIILMHPAMKLISKSAC